MCSRFDFQQQLRSNCISLGIRVLRGQIMRKILRKTVLTTKIYHSKIYLSFLWICSEKIRIYSFAALVYRKNALDLPHKDLHNNILTLLKY